MWFYKKIEQHIWTNRKNKKTETTKYKQERKQQKKQTKKKTYLRKWCTHYRTQTKEEKCCHIDKETIIHRFHYIFPISVWIRYYTKEDLNWDIMAGISLGAMILPQCIAYASIAGIPSDRGLYTALFGLFIYPFFGTSKHITIGSASIAAIMVVLFFSLFFLCFLGFLCVFVFFFFCFSLFLNFF